MLDYVQFRTVPVVELVLVSNSFVKMLYFYCTNDVDVQGPISGATLKDMYSAGQLSLGTKVCAEGASEWREIQLVLRTLIATPAPPLLRPKLPANFRKPVERVQPVVSNVIGAPQAASKSKITDTKKLADEKKKIPYPSLKPKAHPVLRANIEQEVVISQPPQRPRYFLAEISCSGLIVIYALIGAALDWKHGGGAFPMVLLSAAFWTTWRHFTKMAE
jgi:hypothetical protein